MRQLTLIVKPTLLCNCACKYCITPQKVPSKKISEEIIELLCKKMSNSKVYDYFTFIWHGGEPLLMGVDFYKRVLSIQDECLGRGKFTNTFQSNCTLINDDWIDFFKVNKIRVSTSLDGDKDSHDINRIKNGKGTFDEIYANIKRLQSVNLFSGVVTVLSKTNVKQAPEFLKFFAANNIPARLNPILPAERMLNNDIDLSIDSTDYADCLITCFDNWIDGNYNTPEGKPLRIAPLTDIVYNIYSKRGTRLCVFSESCSDNFMAINPIGDLYNCGRFCDIEGYKVANIFDDGASIDSIIEKKKLLTRWNVPSTADDACRECKWYSICHRGCPNSSYIFSGRIMEKDPFCEGYKKLFTHIYDRLPGNK